MKKISRRSFLSIIGAALLGVAAFLMRPVMRYFTRNTAKTSRDGQGLIPGVSHGITSDFRVNLGVDPDGISRVYLARGGSPEENMRAVLKGIGGIDKVISHEDIVILKPNAQWWNQGMTNTNAMKAFIEETLAIPSFSGEIIICDNHQFGGPDSRAWTTEQRNGDYNYNELIAHFNNLGFRNVTKYHWQCAGPNPKPIHGDASLASKRVQGPGEGDGYVWREDMIYMSPLGRKCLLTYPVFTSVYSGTTIDLKNGAWKNGAYTGQPVKLINFSVLNHHSTYVGFTASVKNFMGIVDMTCGFQGTTPKRYYNTHYIGLRDLKIPFYDKLPWRIRNRIDTYNYKYFCHTGAVLGRFMKDIRMPDLNIITAHWVGYGSRTDAVLSAYPRAILASRDPVALDYVGSREILMPVTATGTYAYLPYLLSMNDATAPDGPAHRFLAACHEQGIGNLEPDNISLNEV